MSDKIRKLKDDAATLTAKGKFDKAIELYNEILAAEPDDLQTLLRAGDAYRRLGKDTEAVEAYEKVARGYGNDGLLLKAIAVCKMILEIDEAHSSTQALLADLYAKKSGGRAKLNLVLDTSAIAAESPAPSAGEGAAQEKDLPVIPLFSDLSKNAFIQLMEQMTMHTVAPGAYIIREGEVGHSFFIISQGRVKVSKLTESGEQMVLAHLEDNAFFGEMALLSNSPRNASIIAEEETTVFEVSKEVLDKVCENYVSVRHVLIKFYKQRLLSNLLAVSPVFRPLSPAQRKDLIEKFKSREVPEGTVLLQQGDKGDGLYLILSGEVKGECQTEKGLLLLNKLKDNDVFGEISLLTQEPVSATITTTKNSIILRLPRKSFTEVAMSIPQLLIHVSELAEERRRINDAVLRGEMVYRDDGLVVV